jgi:hypothetical protein
MHRQFAPRHQYRPVRQRRRCWACKACCAAYQAAEEGAWKKHEECIRAGRYWRGKDTRERLKFIVYMQKLHEMGMKGKKMDDLMFVYRHHGTPAKNAYIKYLLECWAAVGESDAEAE